MAAEDNKGLLLLLAVCREWRNLIIDSPALWRRLEVSRKTTKKKLDFWMSRSKGKVSSLIIIGIWRKTWIAHVFMWFSKFPDEFWAGLETLEIDSSEDLFLAMVDAGMFERSRLRNFRFEKDYGGVPRSLNDFTFTTLTSLQIAGDFGEDLFAMLDRNPSLTWLSLTRRSPRFRDREVNNPKHVELRHLTHLELCGFHDPMPSLKTSLRIPNLQSLAFRGSWTKPCSPSSCAASVDLSGLPYLRELRLLGCEPSTDEVKRVLRSTSNITTLELLQREKIYSYDTASWLESLNPSTTDAFLCPFLQHIKFSGYRELDLRSLVQFVEGRLQGSSSEGSPEISPSERPRRIMSVHIENCRYLLHSVKIKWLKANVPLFTIRRDDTSD